MHLRFEDAGNTAGIDRRPQKDEIAQTCGYCGGFHRRSGLEPPSDRFERLIVVAVGGNQQDFGKLIAVALAQEFSPPQPEIDPIDRSQERRETRPARLDICWMLLEERRQSSQDPGSPAKLSSTSRSPRIMSCPRIIRSFSSIFILHQRIPKPYSPTRPRG